MAVEIRVPQLGESLVEATLGRWLKKEGDTVSEDEPLVELETDKVNTEVTSSASGVLERILRSEGDTVTVNEVLAVIGGNGSTAATSAPTPAVETASAIGAIPAANGMAATESTSGRSAVSPVAKKLAEANNVDIAQVKGTGEGGKIVKEDVEAYIGQKAAPVVEAKPVPVVTPPITPPVTPKVETAAAPPVFFATEKRAEERRPMTRRRQAIATNLKVAQNTAAMLTTFNEVDMGAIMELRKRRNETFEKRYGVKIGFMSFFTKAVIGALKAFPLLNAEIQGTDILIKHYYDIGIAVGVADGLVVPVVRDADTKTFANIEKEIAELAGRARDNKLTLAELQGGTFTITNGGIFGSLMSTPILNYPQVGILGMHKIQERPVAINGEVVIRPMMFLALSYDHRIVDGGEAVRFLVRVKELLEDPETLLLEG